MPVVTIAIVSLLKWLVFAFDQDPVLAMDMRRLTAALQEGELGQSQLETGQAFKSAALAITTLLRVSQQSTAKGTLAVPG
jgi:hypothetical protein